MCGEQVLPGGSTCALPGSSPRVRGTATKSGSFPLSQRFIPACAGNSLSVGVCKMRRSVHPRVCGEQPQLAESIVDIDGSSPRVRGTAALRANKFQFNRFIPACAGNSNGQTRTVCDTSVHPRVCGEQPFASSQTIMAFGSSPRVRGTVPNTSESPILMRFIPACAGNSHPSQSFTRCPSVHPRVCGEQSADTGVQRHRPGSSPRVRGTGRRRLPAARVSRFIPACAGNRRLRPPRRPT